MLKVDDVINVYERLYRQVYNQPDFVFNFTVQRRKVLNKFLTIVPFTAGQNWIKEYLLFQFYRYSTQKKTYSSIKNIAWVFGDKAYQCWSARTPEELYYCQLFKYKFNIKLYDHITLTNSGVYDNMERNRFFNSLRGYLHCKNLGLNYQINGTCLLCKFKNWCVQEK